MSKKNKWLWIDRESSFYGKNYIGMFDLTKGILMIAIILSHCVNDYVNLLFYGGGESAISKILLSPLTMLRYGAVSMLFLSCGYGIRKQSVKKNVKNNLQMFLIPYMAVILMILFLVLIKQLFLGGVLKERLVYQVLPFLLGFHPGKHLIENGMEQIGPIWFFLTYTFGCIYLNIVLQEKQPWVQALLVGIGSMVALMTANVVAPFCLQQILICSGYMYVGMRLKKGKVLQTKLPTYLVIFTWLICTFATAAGGLVETGSNFYRLGAVDLVITYISGIVLLCLSRHLDRLQGIIAEGLRWIGRHMMWFCCLHTISYLMVPWDKVAMWFGERQILGFIFEFTLSFLYALAGCLIIDKVLKKILYRKRKG